MPSPDYPTFFDGEALRRARKAMDLSSTATAEAVGVDLSSISSYERGYRIPSLLVAARLAHVLGIKIDDLLDHKDPAPKVPARDSDLLRLVADILHSPDKHGKRWPDEITLGLLRSRLRGLADDLQGAN